MRSAPVVVVRPGGNLRPGMVEAEEQALVQELVTHPAVEALAIGVLHRLARRDEVPVTRCSDAQASMAFEVNSVS